jgi:RNA polymerase sigma factor (sigma-70 family)
VREALGVAPSEQPGPADADEAATLVTRLTMREALMRLGPRQRAVLVLRFFEDLTEVEAAAVLDVSVGTVKSQTARALARLREIACAGEEAWR